MEIALKALGSNKLISYAINFLSNVINDKDYEGFLNWFLLQVSLKFLDDNF